MTNWFLDFKVNGVIRDSFTRQRRFSSEVQSLNFRYKFCMIHKNCDFKLQNFCLWLNNSLESKFLAFLYQWYMQRDITCSFILEENLQFSGQTKITFDLYQQWSSLNMYRIMYYYSINISKWNGVLRIVQTSFDVVKPRSTDCKKKTKLKKIQHIIVVLRFEFMHFSTRKILFTSNTMNSN